MKKSRQLAFAISLLAGAQSASALTPWTDGAPDLIVYTSGGAAQDQAINRVVSVTLAAPGTLDTFSDVSGSSIGGRWQSFYFTGNANLSGGLAGKKIVLEKRSYGAAGYGVIPLFANNSEGLPLEHLNIVGTGLADWEVDGAEGGKKWKKTISQANAATYLTKVVSDGGFLGVDPDILLKPNTENYPEQVNEVITGAPEPDWPLTLNQVPQGFTQVSTGGLVYGVAVTEELYKVLQAAQKRAGSLPDSVTIGAYDANSLPNLNRNLLASLLAGKIASWEQVKIVDKNTHDAVSLVEVAADAGIAAPFTNGDGKTPVGVSRRNKGAAVGAVAYAKFLNYPGTANANKPADNTPDGDEDIAAPIVKSPGGVNATNNLLKDWNSGTNASGLNPGLQKIWGIAVNTGDKDAGVNPWRYVKIDGFAPTIENVAAGVYPSWAEGVVLYRTNKSSDSQWADKKALLKTFADDLGSPAVAKAVNTNLPFGISGIFATTKDPRGFTAEIPFNPDNPVVPLTHFCEATGSTQTSIVPVADDQATGGLQIQLK
ncbi:MULTISPECIES: hypothetical protein [Methylomicrobium]|uniref:Uncharacterized protein n=1 Tax=Methylomicrobium album BG8 TaxID=686340 RepID=H8GMN1_METAL|nr:MULTISPECIES: hypothetical protein [Methylomicrobium]EIC28271.1 hypothetical protein Metal_0417 [Methylomicrobium album BG8]